MSVHKTGKYRNLIQGNGLLHMGSSQLSGSDLGFVSEYSNAGTTTYTGLIRHTDGFYYGFDGLTVNPFTLNGSGLAGDVVNTTGTGFALSNYKLGSLTTTTTVTAGSDFTSTAGNISAPLGTSSAGNVAMSANQIVSSNTNGNLSILPNGTGNLILGGINNQVLLPADPSTALGAVTKQYVDNWVQGFTAKVECRVRTVSDLADLATGGIVVSGANATHKITRGQNGLISSDAAAFDGVTLVLNDRVLVMMQGTGTGAGKDNGIYYVTNVGAVGAPWVLTRATDANIAADYSHGAYTFISEGTVYATTGWVLQTANPITLETTILTFVQFSQLGVVTGNQLDVGGSAFNVFRDKTSSNLNFRGLVFTNTVGSNVSAILQGTQSSTDVTLNIDSQKIVTVGALVSGSIATGFGTISTGASITTTDVVTATSLQTTGSSINATGGTLAFSAGSGNNVVSMSNNTADALSIKSGSTNYLQFQTTTGAQQINVGKVLQLNQGNLIFNAATATNILTLPTNLADGFSIKDSTNQSFLQFVSTTGAQLVNANVPVTFNQIVTVAADCYLNGGFRSKLSAVSAGTTLDATYNNVNATAGVTALTVTLPNALANSGRHYKIAKVDSGVGVVTVTPAASDYVDGIQNDTIALPSKDDHVHIVSHGSAGWYVY